MLEKGIGDQGSEIRGRGSGIRDQESGIRAESHSGLAIVVETNAIDFYDVDLYSSSLIPDPQPLTPDP